MDNNQGKKIADGFNEMVLTSIENGLPPDKVSILIDILAEYVDVFCVSLSAGPPADVSPIKIVLLPDAVPVRVRLCEDSQDPNYFLEKMVEKITDCGMIHENTTSRWESAPLLVPKTGPDLFLFTVYLRPVNRFTVRHQFPMPIIDHKFQKLFGSTVLPPSTLAMATGS